MSKGKKIMRKLKTIMLTAMLTFAVAGMISGNAMAATKWTVTPATKTINVDKSVTLKTNKNVKWTISTGAKVVKLTDKKVKSVKVTGLKAGTATVKAKNTATGATKTVKITVVPKLTLTASKQTVNVGTAVTLKTNNNVKWSIANGTGVVKFTSKANKTAKISTLKAGTATIKAVDAKTGVYKTVKITVVPKLSVSSTNLNVSKGKYKTLTANNDVKWTVKSGSEYIELSNQEKRSVRVTGLKTGQAYIKAENTKTGAYKTIKVTVSMAKASSEMMNKVLSGEDTATKLIDARNSDAYAGWALDEAVRGGHFEGAMNLDAAWIGNAKLDGIIADNGISENGTYIIYDTNGKDAVAMAEYLDSKGIVNVSTYNAVNEINGDAKLISYENYDLTVPASVVKNISDNVVNGTELNDLAKAVVGDSKDIVILECSWGAPEETNYVKNHVPGALHIDTNETDPPGVYVEAANEQYLYDYKYEWRLGSDEHLIKLFSSRGVTKDSCVIVTGSSAAPVSRCGVILRYIGVENVHIMSKGYTDWKAAGYEFETVNRNADLPNGPQAIEALSATEAAAKFGASEALHPEYYETTETVLERLGDADYQLVDNRRLEEWNGGEHGYDYEDLSGRIDGSILSTQNSYNPDNSMRSKLLQDAKWTKDGVDLSKHMVFFCGDGWRAAVDTWNAWVLGYDAAIYHGWMEWSNSGCEFINKDGQKVHYDKDLQAVVDSEGTIVQKLTMKLQFEKDVVSVSETGTYAELNTLINKTGIEPIYSSSDENLVKVDSDGTVEVLAIPAEETKVEITALVKDFDNNYMGAKDRSVVYTLNLCPPEGPFVPVEATKEEVEAILDGTDTTTVLVDARPQEAYAGWALQGAKNGGHLKNAVLYSARWLDFEISSSKREKKLTAYNSEIELSAEKSYIVYDYAGIKDAAEKVAEYFYGKGVKNVKVFNAKEMINEGSNLVSYENYDRFLPSEIVKDISDYKTGKDDSLLEATTAVISEDEMDKVVIIDVSYGNVHESSYLSDGHVPGAVHMNTNVYERPRIYVPEKREKYGLEYSLIPVEEFRDEVCPQYGITKDSIVIAMSSDGRPIGRLGYMLRSLGVEYYGMSGLMNAWKYNGFELDTTTVVKPTPVEEFGLDTIPYPDEIVWMDEVKEILAANGEDENNHTAGTIVGSAKYSTYSYHDLMGKIQGTVDTKDGTFENVDGTPVMAELMVKYYNKNNIPTDKLIVHFCGDGWGAARDAYNAQSVDLNNVKYWGEGWVVWSNQGNWFLDYTGRKVRYDKHLDAVVDVDGNIITDDKVMKIE